MCVCLHTHTYVCTLLFEIRNRIVPTGSTPEGGPTEVSPTTNIHTYIHTSIHTNIHTHIHTCYWSKTYYASTMSDVILGKSAMKHLSMRDSFGIVVQFQYGNLVIAVCVVGYVRPCLW